MFSGEYGFVHLDLKPENVLMSTDGKLYVIDFGGAQYKSKFDEYDTRTFTEIYLAPVCWDLHFSTNRRHPVIPNETAKEECVTKTFAC